ncbi:MAG: hypothetical protein JXJ04_22185 [Spirochaetales bacterium]|nr:hypothetical protein [Spirochaetales bacterium]
MRFFILLLIIILSPPSAFPGDGIRGEHFFSGETWEHLVESRELVHYFNKKTGPTLLPETDEKEEITEQIRAVEPAVGVEMLILAPVPEGLTGGPGQPVLDKLSSIATLRGHTYFSPREKKREIFFVEAFSVTGPGEKTKVEDPVFSMAEKSAVFFARFKDRELGWYNCRLVYRFPGDYMSIEMENTTPMKLLVIPVIKPGRAMNYYFITRTGDYIIFYGLTCVGMTNIFNIAEAKGEDFYYRTKAIYQWMKGILDSTE